MTRAAAVARDDVWEQAKTAARALAARPVGQFVLGTDLLPGRRYECPSCGSSRGFGTCGDQPGFKCHSCDRGWDNIGLAEEFLTGVSGFRDALRALGGRFFPHLDLGEPPSFTPHPALGNGASRPRSGAAKPGREVDGWWVPEGFELVEVYDYPEPDGRLLHQTARMAAYDDDGARVDKTFRPRWRPTGTAEWKQENGDLPWPLYGEGELVEALALDKLVLLVEGEDDTNSARELGLVATTPKGAGWELGPHNIERLKGARVVLLADMDETGTKKAQAAADALQGVVAELRILRSWPGFEMGSGADLSEWLKADPSRDAAALMALVDVLPLSRSDADTEPPPSAAAIEEVREASTATADLTLTDSGNSSRLVNLHGHRLHHIASWAKWIVWNVEEGRWTLDHGDVRVRELAKEVGRQLKLEAASEPDEVRAKKLFKWGLTSLNAHRIGAEVNLARGIGDVPLDHEELDADGWLLGVQNGVIDLRTGRLRPSVPADLMTRQAPVRWNDDAAAPRWDQAMREWFPDPDVRSYVQRVAGSALIGEQRDHVFVIHYGLGGNGKGTFSRALLSVLGPYVVEVHLTLLVETKFREHDTVKADLFRTRLALAVETDSRVKLAEASVKKLTGGDRIRARRMREDPWSFVPSHSLWLQTNHLPELGGRDTGIWRRIRVVKWERTFSDREQDRGLDDTLAREAPGILRWLVEGCLAYQLEGLAEPESVIRDTLAYREAEDTLSRFEADIGLMFSSALEFPAAELQELLSEWANTEGLDPPSRGLGDWLKENGARQTRTRYLDEHGKRRQRRVWVGVGIDDGNHKTEQTNAL